MMLLVVGTSLAMIRIHIHDGLPMGSIGTTLILFTL